MFNQATIIGRLGKDPELRTLPNGRAVANFSLATTERWKDKESGDQREKTEWHNIAAYGRQGEILAEFTHKGDLLMVQGKLETRKWQDKEGNDRYTTQINVQNFTFMPNPVRQDQDGGGSRRPAAERDEAAEGFDDDIPF